MRDSTLHGEFVHDVGEIQLHVTNFGLIGSLPGNTCSFCDAPSAMWPAGSGADHVYEAGLWIRALLDGQPLITTATPGSRELRDDEADPQATIYEASEGDPGGRRCPHPGFDDDAILAAEPDHRPLHLRVVQESFAWSDDGVDDFVAFEFTITASENFPADRMLEDVYLGFYVDPDTGPRGVPGIATDDLPYFFDDVVETPEIGLVPLTLAAAHDADGDGGASPGSLGVLFFDRPMTGFRQFVGNRPAGEGGDPGDDAERYALLSTSGDDDTPTGPENADDYRILISTGPIERCGVDDETGLRLALVVGAGSNGLLTNATQAYLTALGRFFDRDADPQAGDDGREYRVAWIPPGQGRTVASGVYLVRLVTDRGVDTRRIVLAR